MNLPNKLTIFRIILIPFFVAVLLLWPDDITMRFTATTIFVVASITDFLDGYIARKNNLVTNFGKFFDPLADKLLVSAALICLVDIGLIPTWIVIVILSREFFITGLRTLAADNGIVIAASYWGKFKTVFQMIMIIFLLAMDKNFMVEKFSVSGIVYDVIANILIYISLAFTIISLIDYTYKNRKVFKEPK